MYQKSELPLFYGSPTTEYLDFLPTTKAVGSYFVTNSEPTALVVGAQYFRTNGFSRWSTN